MTRPPKIVKKREYKSPVRDAAREVTREAIVIAATRVLRERGWDQFSVDAVARAASVTRLTVYHQFGERRALLEAVFDAQAASSGLAKAIPKAMSSADPHEALERVVAVFCAFWEKSGSMHALMAAATTDAQLAEAIKSRNERRRTLLRVLVDRMVSRGEIASRRATRLVDTLFALTSFAFFEELSTAHVGREATRETIASLAAAAVEAQTS
jgi:AcrR family transcriptional regulator